MVRARIDDARPSKQEVAIALQAARSVAGHLREGRVCLVTCHAGLNRSGLVSGLALRMLGYDGESAVRAVRAARGQQALGNEHFRRIVRHWEG